MELLGEIHEIERRAAPGPEPLGLAFDGTLLWIASRESRRLYAVDPTTWTVAEEAICPGAPFGIAVNGNALRVIVGFVEDDDDRYLYRFVRGRGFESERIACPGLSGVHVAFSGARSFCRKPITGESFLWTNAGRSCARFGSSVCPSA